MSNSSISRRRFLATGSAVASGLVLMRNAFAAGKEEIKIGMIGCGSRGGAAAAECMNADPCVKLTAMGDLFESRISVRRNYLAKTFPDQVVCPEDHCFTGLDSYKSVIENCDAVLIACATKFHPMYAEAGIRAGKHVFLEKPHAIDPAGIKRLFAAAETAERKSLSIMSGYQSRWLSSYAETIRMIHEGVLGEIVAIESLFLRGSNVPGKRDPGQGEMMNQLANWGLFNWLSGDSVMQSLSHNLDRISWVMQEKPPLSAHASGGSNEIQLWKKAPHEGMIFGDLFDHGSITYEYPGGVRYYAGFRTALNCFASSGDVIMGEKAICHFPSCRILKRDGTEINRYKGPMNSGTQTEQDEFIAAIKSGKPINRGKSVCRSSQLAFLGLTAAYQGNLVPFELISDSDYNLGGVAPDDIRIDSVPPVLPDEQGYYPVALPGNCRFPLAGK